MMETEKTVLTTSEEPEEIKTPAKDSVKLEEKEKIIVADTPENRTLISEKIKLTLETDLINLESKIYNQWEYLFDIKQELVEIMNTHKELNDCSIKKPDPLVHHQLTRNKQSKSEKIDEDKLNKTHIPKKNEGKLLEVGSVERTNPKSEDKNLKKNKSDINSIKVVPDHPKIMVKTKSERKIEPKEIKEIERKRPVTAKSVAPKEVKPKKEEEKKVDLKNSIKPSKTPKRSEDHSFKRSEEKKREMGSDEKKKDTFKKEAKTTSITPKSEKKDDKRIPPVSKKVIEKPKNEKLPTKNVKNTKEEKKLETSQKNTETNLSKTDKHSEDKTFIIDELKTDETHSIKEDKNSVESSHPEETNKAIDKAIENTTNTDLENKTAEVQAKQNDLIKNNDDNFISDFPKHIREELQKKEEVKPTDESNTASQVNNIQTEEDQIKKENKLNSDVINNINANEKLETVTDNTASSQKIEEKTQEPQK